MKNILIVDDDFDIHGLFKVELKSPDIKLFFANDADGAIEILKTEYINITFLDIILGVNQTSQAVMSYSKTTPVFLMSAHITEEYTKTILDKHTSIVDCIKKPFEKGELLERVLAFDFDKWVEENEIDVTISGATDDIQDENSLVKGSPEEEEEKIKIEGATDNIEEGSELVKGSKEEDEEETRISGATDEIKEETELVKGEKEEEDKFKETIEGEKEDLKEELTVVSSTNEEEKDLSLVSSGEENSSEEEEQYKNDIKFLTKKGKGSRTLDGYTRLMIAVLLGNKIEVDTALNDGEGLEDKCKGGFTPLHLAVLKNNLELTTYLLDKGAKITAKDNDNREALFFAIQKNNFDIASLLVERGAPTNRRFKGKSYLIMAAIKKNLLLFKLMKSQGISPEIRDDSGYTVKHYLKKFKLEHFLKESA
jgi:CheY-like chemotaxis protein